MNITEDKRSGCLDLMLMSSSPGILDGDEYEMKIEVAAGCALQLHTQAYQRLFNMKLGASQQMDVHIADGASFCYLPHPAVPHEQSIFTSRNNFYLGNKSNLLFGEILTCGRKLNGEQFLLSKYHSVSHVYVNDKLVIKENLLVQPSFMNVNGIGQLEGYTHQASLVYLDETADIKHIQSILSESMASEKDIEFGMSAAPVNGLVIRILGNGAEQLFACFQRINSLLHAAKINHHAV